jgi:hypothetical protein
MKGAAATGAAAASAGAGAILSIIVAGCELIAKVVYRLLGPNPKIGQLG